MKIIDADKFLSYLIFSKHIDGLTCGEVKEAIEMSKIDILDKIEEEINSSNRGICDYFIVDRIEEIIKKYKVESDDEHMTADELAELFIENEE